MPIGARVPARKSCGYFGHPEDCACDYDPVGELRWRWFWPLLADEAQQTLLQWYRGTVLEGGSAAADRRLVAEVHEEDHQQHD